MTRRSQLVICLDVCQHVYWSQVLRLHTPGQICSRSHAGKGSCRCPTCCSVHFRYCYCPARWLRTSPFPEYQLRATTAGYSSSVQVASSIQTNRHNVKAELMCLSVESCLC
eukprot:07925_4